MGALESSGMAARKIPIIGNGDILTPYEAAARKDHSGCAALMVGRGALIKPWIFKELVEGKSYHPSAAERVEVYWRLASYMKEHFRDDDKGKSRAMYFLPWHFSFFCRYRPWEQFEWEEASRSQPLIQTRPPEEAGISKLERLLRNESTAVHAALAEILWESSSNEEAVARTLAFADAAELDADMALDERSNLVGEYQG
ncbi:MAG: hypothetical protein EBZ48_03205 [Proteobacteria bacterium]|nr:hypothetical protein [Pseudomonadota bacterium]